MTKHVNSWRTPESLREVSTTVGVIGVGNMGSALVKGWLRADAAEASAAGNAAGAPARGGPVPGETVSPIVLVWDKVDARIQRLLEELGPSTGSLGPPLGRLFAAGSLPDLVAKADVVVVVVKPNDARDLLEELGRLARDEQAVVSAMAGLTLGSLRGALGPGPALFRIMPNLAVEVGAGAVALAVESDASPDSIATMLALLRPLGVVEQVAEELFDVVTAVSGSSPAFLAVAIEALEDGAVAAGLARDKARAVVRRAARSAAEHMSDGLDVAEGSRCGPDRVWGSDPALLRFLEEREVRPVFRRAVEAAVERSRQMQEQ
jgi:pyrroline-5-carboxylate reductase